MTGLSEYLSSCFEQASARYGPLAAIGVSLSESAKSISFHFNVDNHIDESMLAPSQFEHQGQFQTSIESITYDRRAVQQGVWDATKLAVLPTTLCCFDDETENFFAVHTELETFGRFVVQHFRNEAMQGHDDYLQSLGILGEPEPLVNRQKDVEPETRRALASEFFMSLTDDQLRYMRKYVLRTVDTVAFNVMRALDEHTGQTDSAIEVRSQGIDAVDLPLIGNGNLSGEYLDWVERFSKFGRFQV